MMGSTSNALDKGGRNYKKLYDGSNVTKRNRNGQTSSGLYSLFIPMEWNYEGYIDTYGYPVFDTPKSPVKGIDEQEIEIGVIEHWENEVDGLKEDPDGLNELYRQFPRTEKHAFRDETKQSLFNLTKIYEQIDYNEDLKRSGVVTQGNFQWEDGIKDTRVIFSPNKNGRFMVSWIPKAEQQNRFITNIIAYISNKLFSSYMSKPYSFHLNRNSSELIKNIQLEIYYVHMFLLSLINLIIESWFIIAILSTLIYIEPTGEYQSEFFMGFCL